MKPIESMPAMIPLVCVYVMELMSALEQSTSVFQQLGYSAFHKPGAGDGHATTQGRLQT